MISLVYEETFQESLLASCLNAHVSSRSELRLELFQRHLVVKEEETWV